MRPLYTFLLVLFIIILHPLHVFCAERHVSPSGKDSHQGDKAAPWRTLQHAANSVRAGDIVIVHSGEYAGFKAASSGAPNAPIVFRAAPKAKAVINRPGPDNWHGSVIEIENHDWWEIVGFEISNAPQSAGVDVRMAAHVLVRDCVIHHNKTWGIFTAFAHHFKALGNECSYSGREHGIYVSNSSDDNEIRGNVCHHNYCSGIQFNADPSMGDDGISSRCLIVENILYENGRGGGAAVNLASVRDSLIANNLIYGNHASGIAGWDDGQGEQWGSKNNTFVFNTVHQPHDGRWGLSLKNGSTGNEVLNNILLHENTRRGGLELDSSSRHGLHSDYNILKRIDLDERVYDLDAWREKSGLEQHSKAQSATKSFMQPGKNYQLRAEAYARNHGRPHSLVKTDIQNTPRPQGDGVDMGCYERP